MADAQKSWFPSFAAVLGAVVLMSQVVIQYRGGQTDSTLIYAGLGLALGVPIGHILDTVRNNKNGGPK